MNNGNGQSLESMMQQMQMQQAAQQNGAVMTPQGQPKAAMPQPQGQGGQ